MTGGPAPGELIKDKRARLRSEHKAESTWRRHEIAGRIAAIRSDVKSQFKQLDDMLKVAVKLLSKPPRVVEGKEAPKELEGGDEDGKREGDGSGH